MKKGLIVIPIHNEGEVLSDLIDRLERSKFKNSDIHLDTLFINDKSQDNSEEILIDKKVNYISLVNNLGIGGAVQAGYIFAKKNNYDFVIQIDGDGQHPPENLERLINSSEQCEEDLIIGSRFKSKSDYIPSKMRKTGMIFSSVLLKLVSGIKIHDTTSGFRLTKKRLLYFFSNEYPQREAGLISLLMAAKFGFKFKEIPLQINQRIAGKSSINNKRALLYPFIAIIQSIKVILIKRS